MRCFRLSWVCSWDCACLRSSAKKWLYRDFAVALAILVVYAVNRFLLKPVMPNHAIGYFLKCHFNDFLGGILFPIYVSVSDKSHLLSTLLSTLTAVIVSVAPYTLMLNSIVIIDTIAIVLLLNFFIQLPPFLTHRQNHYINNT